MRVFVAITILVAAAGSVVALEVHPDPVEAGEVVRGATAIGQAVIRNPSGETRTVEIVAPEGCRAEPRTAVLESGADVGVGLTCVADRSPGRARWRFGLVAEGEGDAPPPVTLRADVVPAASLLPDGPIDLGNAGGRAWSATRVIRPAVSSTGSPPALDDQDAASDDDLDVTLEAVREAGELDDGTPVGPGDWWLTVRTDPLPPGDHERDIRVRTGVETDPYLDIAVDIRVMPLLRGDAFEWTVPEPDPESGSFAEYVVTPRTGVSAAEVEVFANPAPLSVMTALDRRRLRVRIEIPPDPGDVPARGEVRFEWNGESQIVPVTVGGDPPPSQPRTRTKRTPR